MQCQGHVCHFWFRILCPYMKDLDFNKLFQCIMKPYTTQCERKQWFIQIFYTFSIVALCASSKINFGNYPQQCNCTRLLLLQYSTVL
jgi:hypothetical protein